jgi:hypothetical protein
MPWRDRPQAHPAGPLARGDKISALGLGQDGGTGYRSAPNVYCSTAYWVW